jgi:hypothetical protein
VRPVAVWHVGILSFPLGPLEEIRLGHLPLFCAIALNLRHASTAEYQCPEFIDQPILLIRIVVGKILFQSS